MFLIMVIIQDFTYIDDIVEGILKTLYNPPSNNDNWNNNQPDPVK